MSKHPGSILRGTFMQPLQIDAVSLHIISGVPTFTIVEIVRGNQAIDRRTAVLLGEALGTGPEFWLQAQQDYETEERQNDIRNTGVSALLFGLRSEKDGAR